jgi:glucose/arabinose dehydrogenase
VNPIANAHKLSNKSKSKLFLPLIVSGLSLLLFTSLACASSQQSSLTKPASTLNTSSLKLVKIADFNQPVEIKSAPGYPKLMFVVEQSGVVKIINNGKKVARPFLNISSKVNYGGERGLLSIAFPADYLKSGKFYVYYTDKQGDIRVDEYLRSKNPLLANPGSARPVIEIPHKENSNHNGGQMHFLGDYLYFGTGDGGGSGDPDGNAQNLNVLLGKMIRINPEKKNGRSYSIPATNPFVGKPGRDEIFAYGLRNPFRWSFDKTSSSPRMIIADVGQSEFEEINYLTLAQARGANFGWNYLEGNAQYQGSAPVGTIKPVLTLAHNNGYCSVIGGIVVRDRQLSSLLGQYIFSDFCKGGLQRFTAQLGSVQNVRRTNIAATQISSFGESANGRVWLTSLTGPVYRLR